MIATHLLFAVELSLVLITNVLGGNNIAYLQLALIDLAAEPCNVMKQPCTENKVKQTLIEGEMKMAPTNI